MRFQRPRTAILAAIAAAVALSALAGATQSAWAEYPEKDITIIVPRSPGGGLDRLSRLMAPEWGKKLGVQIVVENIPGASGAIGLAEAYRRPADGYTIVVWSPPGEYVLQLQEKLPFTIDEFELIGATNSDPGFIAVPAGSSFQSVSEILEASRSGDKRISVGTVGRTTISALEAMLYQDEFDVKWGMVPFDGGGDLSTAVIGAHVDFGVREGGWYELHPEKLRILSVAAASRIKQLPEVPTVEEATGEPVQYAAYRGFAVRKGTPPEVLEKLRSTFNEVGQSPAIADTQFEKTKFRYEFFDALAFAAAQDKQVSVANRYKDQILGN